MSIILSHQVEGSITVSGAARLCFLPKCFIIVVDACHVFVLKQLEVESGHGTKDSYNDCSAIARYIYS